MAYVCTEGLDGTKSILPGSQLKTGLLGRNNEYIKESIDQHLSQLLKSNSRFI